MNRRSFIGSLVGLPLIAKIPIAAAMVPKDKGLGAILHWGDNRFALVGEGTYSISAALKNAAEFYDHTLVLRIDGQIYDTAKNPKMLVIAVSVNKGQSKQCSIESWVGTTSKGRDVSPDVFLFVKRISQ